MKRTMLVACAAICILLLSSCQREQAEGIPQQEQPVTQAVAQPEQQPDEGPELDAVYLADNTARLQNELYLSSDKGDECVMLAKTGGVINTEGSSIVKAGDSSSPVSGKDVGLNSAVAVLEGGSVELRDSMISTGAKGASGVFCAGEKASSTIYNGNISTTGSSSPAVSAGGGGMVVCNKLAASTSGVDSPGVYSLAGGFTELRGSNINTAGLDSPAVYAAGKVNAEGSSYVAAHSEGLVIEGAGTFNGIDTDLSGNAGSGVLIYRNNLDKGLEGMATMSMTGGSLSSMDGALLHITNASARINLQAVTADAASGIALYAAGGSWGESGRNGGHVTLGLRQQTLTGDIVCDNISTVYIQLQNNSTYTGVINGDGNALMMDVSLDDTSFWDVTGDSYVSSITDEDASLANIKDNGNNIYYEASLPANDWLDGKEVTLQDGGRLLPR